jgi:HlyD family secretion protein
VNSKNKKILISLIVVLSLTGGTGYFIYKNNIKKEEKKEFITSDVKIRDIVNIVQTNGKVISNLDVEIKCKASGEIVSLPFDISDNVSKGSLLLRLSPVDEQRNVKQAQINLEQSKSDVIKLEQELALSKLTLKTNQGQSNIDLELAKIKVKDLKNKAETNRKLYILGTQRKLALSQIESSKANLKELQDKANRAKQLYETNSLLSKNDYENILNQAKQAQIDLNESILKLNEQDTNNKLEYDSSLNMVLQAQEDVKNAVLRSNQQNNSNLQINIKEQDILSAKSRLEADKISLQAAQQRLSDTEVYAPINGVVTSRTAQVGQIISSGISNVSGGTTVMTISDLSKIFINASIDESDIGKIKIGQKAYVTVDAFPNERFRGEVKQIASKGNNVSNVVTFPVKIEVKSENKKLLRPEMTSNVEITALRKDNILTVSSESVTKNKRKYFVNILNGKEKKEVEVKIGVNDSEYYEVLSGLKEGDKVILEETGKESSKWNKNGNSGTSARSINRNVRRVSGGSSGSSRR